MESLTHPVADAFLKMFESLGETDTVVERLVKLEYGRLEDGAFVLVDGPREMLDEALATIDKALDGGATHREAAERLADAAAARGVTNKSTFVVYAVYARDASGRMALKLYVGETQRMLEQRWKSHPEGCSILADAFASTPNGKDDWVCRPLLALHEDFRSKELLLYFEEALQRALRTVGTPDSLNFHYGKGTYGGVCDTKKWTSKFAEYIGFLDDNMRPPSASSADTTEKTIGMWASRQRLRHKHSSLPANYVQALEALSCWTWELQVDSLTATQKIDALLENPIVIESGGMLLPSDKAMWVNTLRESYYGRMTCVITAEDRKRIDERLPAIVLGPREASFRYMVEKFADEHVDAETGSITYPTKGEECYQWMVNARNGYIALPAERRDFMNLHGLGAFLETLHPEDVREERLRVRKRKTEVSKRTKMEERRVSKAAKEGKIHDAVDVGPIVA